MNTHQQRVQEFLYKRNWEQYHTPKELLLGMIEEIGEFRNVIKWLPEDEVKKRIQEKHDAIDDFFGDMYYELCSLANYCDVDIAEAFKRVMKKHEARFPSAELKGKHTNE